MRHLTHKLITVETWNQIKSIVKTPMQRRQEEEFRRAVKQRDLIARAARRRAEQRGEV